MQLRVHVKAYVHSALHPILAVFPPHPQCSQDRFWMHHNDDQVVTEDEDCYFITCRDDLNSLLLFIY